MHGVAQDHVARESTPRPLFRIPHEAIRLNRTQGSVCNGPRPETQRQWGESGNG
jgi:hypothetical protein